MKHIANYDQIKTRFVLSNKFLNKFLLKNYLVKVTLKHTPYSGCDINTGQVSLWVNIR